MGRQKVRMFFNVLPFVISVVIFIASVLAFHIIAESPNECNRKYEKTFTNISLHLAADVGVFAVTTHSLQRKFIFFS